MCGILFLLDKDSKGQELAARYRKGGICRLEDRGPDGSTSIVGSDWLAIHCLLSITGQASQPTSWRDGLFLFNGEIYNDWRHYSSSYGDTEFLKQHLEAEGIDGCARLDGEFALIVFDEKRRLLYLLSDPFGTKPFYFSLEENRIGAASYDYVLRACGFAETVLMPANSIICIDISRGEIVHSSTLRPFEFNMATCDSYEPFCEAFTLAVAKRAANVQKKIYLPLSSGHDSGLIASEMIVAGIPFTAYGFPFGEVKEVFYARFKHLERRGLSGTILSPGVNELAELREELHKGVEKFRLTLDPTSKGLYDDDDIRAIPGYIAAAYIAKIARSKNELVSMSGQGADEIISDYYNEHTHSRRSYFRGQWEKATAPWPNFYGGWNRLFLEASERIVGHYGIETRYPFLDHGVIQAFLNLTPNAKKKRYKACIAHRLEQRNYPYHDRKLGFSGFDKAELDDIVE